MCNNTLSEIKITIMIMITDIIIIALFKTLHISSPSYTYSVSYSEKYLSNTLNLFYFYKWISHSVKYEHPIRESHCCSARTLSVCLAASCSINTCFLSLAYDSCSSITSRWNFVFDQLLVSSVSSGRLLISSWNTCCFVDEAVAVDVGTDTVVLIDWGHTTVTLPVKVRISYDKKDMVIKWTFAILWILSKQTVIGVIF